MAVLSVFDSIKGDGSMSEAAKIQDTLKNKSHKKLIIVLIIIGVIIVLFFAFGLSYIKRHFIEKEVDLSAALDIRSVDLDSIKKDNRILVVSFTYAENAKLIDNVDAVSGASLMVDHHDELQGDRIIGNCELLSSMIGSSVGECDYCSIITEKTYPDTYSGTVAEAKKEFDNDEDVKLRSEIPDLSKYDTVFIIYPVWWGTIPKAVETFVEQAEFRHDDKDPQYVFAVVSHGGSGKAESVSGLEKAAGIKLSAPVLEVFDDDTTEAKDVVYKWLKKISETKPSPV